MTRCRHCDFPIYWMPPTWRHVANGQSGRAPCNGMVAEPATPRPPIGAGFLAPNIKVTAVQQAAWRLGGRGWVTIRKTDDGYRVWKLFAPNLRAEA